MKTKTKFVLFTLAILLWACSKGNDDNVPSNNPPVAFALTRVTNGATGVELTPTFSWQPAVDPDGDAVSYDLYIDTQTPPGALIEAGIATTTHTLTDSLSLNTAYHWKVVAKDAHGARTESNSAFVFTTGNDDYVPSNNPPAAFGLTAVTNNAIGVDVTPTFSWQPAADPDGDAVTYDLYIDTQKPPLALMEADIATTTYTLTERLSLYTPYHWKVVAKDAHGAQTESAGTFVFTTRGLNNGTLATATAAFSARSFHTSVVFDNKLWVIGGYDGGSRKNDVWYSSDGLNWAQATAATPFSARSSHTSIMFDGKLWVIGGFDGGLRNDVWYSGDGVTWTQATSAAPFSARSYHTSVVFDNKLWVIGGFDGGSDKNDVWYSSDGVSWAQATAEAAFSIRFAHTSTVFDNKLWVIGGSDVSPKNDVWHSSDGITWTEASPAADFPARAGHTSVIFDNKLWVIGGYDGGPKNDVWYSSDGASWVQATAEAAFSVRYSHTSVVFDPEASGQSKLWVIGGTTGGSPKNDVWFME